MLSMKCLGCGMDALAFACDDLDYEKPIDLKKQNTWMLMDGQRPKPCNWSPAWSNGSNSPFHLMREITTGSISSRVLSDSMNKVICSQPN
jgi:hypothetical protein